MDEELKEALGLIEGLRAAIWLAFDNGGVEDAEKNMPEELLEEFHKAAALLAKHGMPDDMMRLDYEKITGQDSEL